jgi:hypothetical protein
MNIPICCVAYNRVNSLRRLLCSLKAADFDEPVTLIISIDKSDSTEVEEFADSYQWIHGEKRVIKHSENIGLRRHVLSCGDLLNEYDALVVLEDDITVAQSFYTYVKQCVEKYKDCMDCAGISLYNFPLSYHNCLPFIPVHSDSDVYMMNCAQSWGQVWMKKQWFEFRKWYATHNEEFGYLPHLPKSICSWPKSSWLKYHTRYCIEENKYFIYPYISLSTNNGDSGTHNKTSSSLFQVPLLEGAKSVFKLTPSVRYDGFFENMNLADYIGVNPDELCVDLYAEKGNREKKRFWLTSSHERYKIINSYALELKPWDVNVKNNIEGGQLFLYDTNYACKNKFSQKVDFERYLFNMKRKKIRTIIKNNIYSITKSMYNFIR